MKVRRKIKDRGMIEMENSNVTCFFGKGDNLLSSKEIYLNLSAEKPKQIKAIYSLDEEKYLIYFPIPQKNISIITNDGKAYKSTIFFIDDIKHIIQGLKLSNPCYYFKGKYIPFKIELDYARFLFQKESNVIKDVEIDTIDEDKLKTAFNNFQIKDSNILNDINKNIYFYSKITHIQNEKYFITQQRTSLSVELDYFYENKKRNEIDDVMYGILGNYASGKSFFLMYYNYKSNYPSIYLNLKVLKNAFHTKGFANLLNNELIILFRKLNKNFDDFKNFISVFSPYGNQVFDTLIISIIEKIKANDAIIIFDQYQEEVFNDKNFIIKLKKILFSKDSNIKVIISSSMNDGPIRVAYLDFVLNTVKLEIDKKKKEEKEEEGAEGAEEKVDDNKTNRFIPYHFLERMVDIPVIKDNIKKKKMDKNKKFIDSLELFNYLPLYFSLCLQHKDNLTNFIEDTKKKIEKKIKKIDKDIPFKLIYLDNIRKMIDNEISFGNLNAYSAHIPFKYFYIEKSSNSKLTLRTHFPLVKEVWNMIIMNEAVNLFDGELKYGGDVIGSLLELNLIINIKNKVIPLDIDDFVEVDTIHNFGEIKKKDMDNDENDTNDYKNKNIFISQRNQNGQYFDIALIKGKNVKSPQLFYIQVKKSLSENKVNNQQMDMIFQQKKNNFFKLFNFIPDIDNVNLVYISLYNDQIPQIIKMHDDYKNDKFKKVSDLGKANNNLVYSINQLYNFCNQNDIQLYYYDPKKHLFYSKNDNLFVISEFDLQIKKKNKTQYIFNNSYLLEELQMSENNSIKLNLNYHEFLQKKRSKPFSYKVNEFDIGIVFEFAEKYFKNFKIIRYVDLHKAHNDFQIYDLPNNGAIICIKINNKNEYEIVSFIYNNHLIKIENDEFKLERNTKLDRENDFLVEIGFDNIKEQLKIFLKNN